MKNLIGQDAARRSHHFPVGELVDQGISGFIADQDKDFPELINTVVTLDRQACRDHATNRFSLERMEQIVRMTTQRELDLIVRLGYLLGAFVGAIALHTAIIGGVALSAWMAGHYDSFGAPDAGGAGIGIEAVQPHPLPRSGTKGRRLNDSVTA